MQRQRRKLHRQPDQPNEYRSATGRTGEPQLSLKENSAWLIALVVLLVFGLVTAVLNHAKDKPKSPQELLVTAFNNTMPQQAALPKWRPGMTNQPLVSKLAAFEEQIWKPLYLCPVHGGNNAPVFDGKGIPYCPICNQKMAVNNQ